MTNNKQIKELHCDGQGGWSDLRCRFGGSGGFGGRPKLPIDAELDPVHGQITALSLPHACLAAGLLRTPEKNQVLNWRVLVEMAEKQWEGSSESFLADAKKVGVNRNSVDKQASKYSGVIIGWSGPSTYHNIALGVCPDIDTTLAVLARRVGNLFISSRKPDYSWERLFGSAFEVDENLCVAPDFRSDPWSRFKWTIPDKG